MMSLTGKKVAAAMLMLAVTLSLSACADTSGANHGKAIAPDDSGVVVVTNSSAFGTLGGGAEGGVRN